MCKVCFFCCLKTNSSIFMKTEKKNKKQKSGEIKFNLI